KPRRLSSSVGRLADFSGDRIYVDAMVLVWALDQDARQHGDVASLFRRATDPPRAIGLLTAALTLDETVFALMRDLVQQPPYSVARDRRRYLAEHPTLVRQLLNVIRPGIVGLTGVMSVEPVIAADTEAMLIEMTATGLLPRDALHVAVMRRLGITAL